MAALLIGFINPVNIPLTVLAWAASKFYLKSIPKANLNAFLISSLSSTLVAIIGIGIGLFDLVEFTDTGERGLGVFIILLLLEL